MKDERRFDLDEWQGQNLLGFSLMRVRTVLQQIDFAKALYTIQK